MKYGVDGMVTLHDFYVYDILTDKDIKYVAQKKLLPFPKAAFPEQKNLHVRWHAP